MHSMAGPERPRPPPVQIRHQAYQKHRPQRDNQRIFADWISQILAKRENHRPGNTIHTRRELNRAASCCCYIIREDDPRRLDLYEPPPNREKWVAAAAHVPSARLAHRVPKGSTVAADMWTTPAAPVS